MGTKRIVVDVRRCRICGERVEYPEGLNLRSGAQVHIACARANTAGMGCRVPQVDPRMVEVAS